MLSRTNAAKEAMDQAGREVDAKRSAIARELERRFQLLTEMLNEHDWECQKPKGQEVESYISTTFKAVFDNVPGQLSWRGLTDACRRWQEQAPDIQYNIHSAQTHVDMEAGEAVVYLEVTISGVGNVTLGGLSEAQWKRKCDGKWMWVHYMGIRGMGHNGGFV
ncbi:hypothetical protein AC578_5612 [Pseudocercospora eumusae]|uniref:SnoaL-like domain-containing protein n=1 Tax=Pseudocercospora eumusae TaxID=321146 RepID=A0A139HT29_9PEZI|nr:hypothetical protein AC578_5612 [Pseudocercospora eumusae]